MFFQLYWTLNNKASLRVRNFFVILASYLFYGWWDWRFLSLIVISSASDYLIGLSLGKEKPLLSKKILLALSVCINLGILGFFKYADFFVESFIDLAGLMGLHLSYNSLSIILPVGISFYTFQTMSYTIDIYRNKLKPTRDGLSFFAFVSFFPQLVAGPIERASHLLPQFFERKKFSYKLCVHGLRLILFGLFKKVVIADNFGLLADSLLNVGNTSNGLTTLLGIFFFAFQIYADFSGYSDMAIGLSKMLGFSLKRNFRIPYFSSSFKEFWSRWHISLSTWFRDYLYIPLGGNRKGMNRMLFNLCLTFLLSGLWHGAKLTFLIWGGLHGLLLALEKLTQIKQPGRIYPIIVFIAVVLLWLPFRAENTAHLTALVKSLVNLSSYNMDAVRGVIVDFSIYRFLLLTVVFLSYLGIETKLQQVDFHEWLIGKAFWVRYGLYYGLSLAILLLVNLNVKPNFIYFQF